MLSTEQAPSEPTPSSEPDFQDKLRELTAQSWNLELIISGAALFATLSLPDWLDGLFNYYRYNLMVDTDYIHETLPAQSLGLIKGICYILFGAFLTNFVMRAFWIGLVGLLAVYPEGIRYDRIYRLSRYAQQRSASEMGTLPDYIIRLDRRCNVVFALAFGVVLILLCVVATYILFIFIETVLLLLVPDAFYETFRLVLGVLSTILVVGYGGTLVILGLPRFRDNARFAALSFRLNEGASVLFMGLYRPLQYILYTFYSQIPEKTLKKRLLWITVIFALTESLFMAGQILDTMNATSLLDARSFMTMRDPTRTSEADLFDNLRVPGESISTASIQSDVIREPYIRLFVSYPKTLDTELTKRFKKPSWPKNLSRKELREHKAAWYLKSLEAYFSVYVNDSLYRSPGFLFTQRTDNGQRGLTTILLNNSLKTGRNLLRITVPDSANVPKTYQQITFWYVPEN